MAKATIGEILDLLERLDGAGIIFEDEDLVRAELGAAEYGSDEFGDLDAEVEF